MAKVLITGGAGFVGSYVAKKFLSDGHQVWVYDTFKQYLLPRPCDEPYNLLIRLKDVANKIEIVQGDTLNKDYLRRRLNGINPDIIVHMAALPLASVAIDHSEEAFDSILCSTVNLMEIMKDFSHDCRLIYASSSMVYGDFKTERVTEESPTDPKEIYGSLKLAGEIIVRGYMKRYGLDTTIVRPSAVYGPYDANQRVLYKFVRQAINGETIMIDGDGSARLDFTYAGDLAAGVYLASTRKEASGEIFNITRGESQSLADAIRVILKKIPGVKIEHRPAPAYMPMRGTLDVSKAKKLLGYQPQCDLEAGLSLYIDHLQQNPI